MDYNMNEPKFNVTDIEFDFDDGNDDESYTLTFDEEIALRDSALGVWEADNEDDLIEEITAAAGWCIKSVMIVTIIISKTNKVC